MIWKNERVRQEWQAMVVGDVVDLLIPAALYFCELSEGLFGNEPVVTGIHRKDLEQAHIIEVVNEQRLAEGLPPWSPSRKSVHQYWRGIDFRSWVYMVEQREELIVRVNKRFHYGRNLKVLAYHARGTAGHMHLQIPHGESWRMG